MLESDCLYFKKSWLPVSLSPNSKCRQEGTRGLRVHSVRVDCGWRDLIWGSLLTVCRSSHIFPWSWDVRSCFMRLLCCDKSSKKDWASPAYSTPPASRLPAQDILYLFGLTGKSSSGEQMPATLQRRPALGWGPHLETEETVNLLHLTTLGSPATHYSNVPSVAVIKIKHFH